MKSRAYRYAALTLMGVLLAAFAAPMPVHAVPPPITCYVNASATPPGMGGDWASAYTDLQSALTRSACVEVWVAAGVYKPGLTQTDSFIINPDVRVYGGFVGTETLRSQRDPAAHVTILSGDIDGNDINTDGNFIDEYSSHIQGNNSYNIVSLDGTDVPVTSNTVLDGFVITGGDGTYGGGLHCSASGIFGDCSPTLRNLTFIGNRAYLGAALYTYGAQGGKTSPAVSNATFSSNGASYGGAVYSESSAMCIVPGYCTGNTSALTFTNVTFSGNVAQYGGALLNDAGEASAVSPVLTNVTFSGNIATVEGGALWNAVAHTATGWGISNPALTNVILWGNTAPAGPEIYNYNASHVTVTISYSIVQGSMPGGVWDTSLGVDGGGNLDLNPSLRGLRNNGGYTRTIALLATSPAVDGGTNVVCPSTDQRGQPRPMDGNHDGTATCDIGAFESPLFADVPVAGKEWMEGWVDVFYSFGITTGCGINPLIYCPENNVTRAEMAVFLLRAKHGSSYTPPPAKHSFTDVPVPGKEWMEPWIDQFFAEGITTGCGIDPIRFCPEQNVTRAEMAVFVLRAHQGSGWSPPAAADVFDDVPVPGKEWMEPWIIEFYNAGITTGCGLDPLRYCPENNTTRAEMAVFIDRAYGLYP